MAAEIEPINRVYEPAPRLEKYLRVEPLKLLIPLGEVLERLCATPVSHEELVRRAVSWLQGRGGCSVVFSEFATLAIEAPDAIGFSYRWSVVVECKVSRADFFADQRKPFRRTPRMGMGAQRYYMVPAGMVTVDELPPKWGLLYVHGRHVSVVRKSEGFADRQYISEIGFLVSMLRRIKLRAIAQHAKTGNACPSDVLNQWIKADIR